MSETSKVTKRQVLEAIKELAEQDVDGMFSDTVSAKDVIAYAETTIAQLDSKAEKARAKAAEKKVEGDELRERIFNILTDEYKTIADIVAELDDPDVTPSKVTARLTQLTKAERVHKKDIKIDSRKLKGYAVGGEAPVAEAEAEAEE